MRPGTALVVVGLLGCSKASAPADSPAPATQTQTQPAPPTPPAIKPPDKPPATSAVKVQMTAATLADDCGGNRPPAPPKQHAKAEAKSKAKANPDLKGDSARGVAARACEQSSMQLAIDAPAGAMPGELHVKRVELFDETGASLGELTASAPTRWLDLESYVPWDQRIEPGHELAVSYALSQPSWRGVKDRWNKTYVVKAVISVGGADQTVQQSVEVSAPTSLPPGVKT